MKFATEEERTIAVQAVVDIVRDACAEDPNTDASSLKKLAESAAKAIAAGVSKLPVT